MSKSGPKRGWIIKPSVSDFWRINQRYRLWSHIRNAASADLSRAVQIISNLRARQTVRLTRARDNDIFGVLAATCNIEWLDSFEGDLKEKYGRP